MLSKRWRGYDLTLATSCGKEDVAADCIFALQ